MFSTKDDKGSNLLDAFQLYSLPTHLSQDYIDPVDGHVHRFQNRCLGISSIKSGSQVYPQATFYEITESEISEITPSPSPCTKPPSSSSSPSSSSTTTIQQQQQHEVSSSSPNDNDQQDNNNMIKGLPPKKRKKRRMIRYEIIFTVDEGLIQLSCQHTFYMLPRDAVTESLTDSAPYKLLFSFYPTTSFGCGSTTTINNHSQCGCHHPSDAITAITTTTTTNSYMEESNGNAYKTKLEEFAAVCSTSCKLALSPTEQHRIEGINNIILSNVPHELYRAIKQMVSAYESMCQNMMELMKLHTEKAIYHKSEMDFLPENDVTNPLVVVDEDYHHHHQHHQVVKNEEWNNNSSNDEHSIWDKVSRDDGIIEHEEQRLEEKVELTTTTTAAAAAAATTTKETFTEIIPTITTPPSNNHGKSSNTKHKSTNGSRGNTSTTTATTSNQIKKCLYCGSKSTPMWRRGPQGAGTLCNACGVKWKHGKILNGMETTTASTTDNGIATLVAAAAAATGNNRRANGGTSQKKRKRTSVSNTTSNKRSSNNISTTKKRSTSVSSARAIPATTDDSFYDAFAVPAIPQPQPQQQQQQHWEGVMTTSSSSTSTTDSRSPLESFTSSPNTSPSVTTLIDQQQQQQQNELKRAADISNLMSYDTETLSVYVGEDAVEAAAVLTLLKRS